VSGSLSATPSPFPLDFDEAGDRLLCLDLTETDFRAASFLDERLLAKDPRRSWIDSAEAAGLAPSLDRESDFIFHIGHVGSTLLSRLLGSSERVFALREPAILRTLARRESTLASHLDSILRLLARVWRPNQRSLIKATSFVSDIAPTILTASPTTTALLMFVAPQVHMATRLAGPAARAELPAVANGWLERLHRRIGGSYWRLEALSEGERAALGWVCEICSLARASQSFPARTRWLDFEAFLADPVAGLGDALSFLYGGPLDGEIAAILAGGDLGRYSKAPEFGYDAATRRQTMADGLREHGAEIARGIAWINAAANAHPAIAAAVRLPAASTRRG
jgi:hypothetical protein